MHNYDHECLTHLVGAKKGSLFYSYSLVEYCDCYHKWVDLLAGVRGNRQSLSLRLTFLARLTPNQNYLARALETIWDVQRNDFATLARSHLFQLCNLPTPGRSSAGIEFVDPLVMDVNYIPADTFVLPSHTPFIAHFAGAAWKAGQVRTWRGAESCCW